MTASQDRCPSADRRVTAHACSPRPETIASLRDLSRTSMRDTCQECGAANVFVMKNSGEIVVFEPKAKGARK